MILCCISDKKVLSVTHLTESPRRYIYLKDLFGERLHSRSCFVSNLPHYTQVCDSMPAAIIGREIAMSALREWAASLGGEAHKAVAVSPLGKWKTTTQVSYVLIRCSPWLVDVWERTDT